VTIPDAGGAVVNLQFSRFAGCPICNMHLATYRSRVAGLQQAGVKGSPQDLDHHVRQWTPSN